MSDDELVLSGLYETIQSHDDNCQCDLCVRYYFLLEAYTEEETE
jgi:hypothetical protein